MLQYTHSINLIKMIQHPPCFKSNSCFLIFVLNEFSCLIHYSRRLGDLVSIMNEIIFLGNNKRNSCKMNSPYEKVIYPATKWHDLYPSYVYYKFHSFRSECASCFYLLTIRMAKVKIIFLEILVDE